MTDKELLKLAAKAANKDISWESSNMFGFWAHDLETGCEWNPLTDDGDALRLAVKLGLFMRAAVREIPRDEYDAEPYAATRRAIVRAAAEIGKSMS